MMKIKMNRYLELFGIFFKIGSFTIGGGYAMIPLIEDEIVNKRHWIDNNEFINLLAISQSAPGVLAVNIAIFIGYKLKGVKGSIITALGAVVPSFIIILSIALFFKEFKDNSYVEALFKGIRPAVVALIAIPVFNLAKSAKVNIKNCWIPILAIVAICWMNFSVIWVIIITLFAATIYHFLKR